MLQDDRSSTCQWNETRNRSISTRSHDHVFSRGVERDTIGPSYGVLLSPASRSTSCRLFGQSSTDIALWTSRWNFKYRVRPSRTTLRAWLYEMIISGNAQNSLKWRESWAVLFHKFTKETTGPPLESHFYCWICCGLSLVSPFFVAISWQHAPTFCDWNCSNCSTRKVGYTQ